MRPRWLRCALAALGGCSFGCSFEQGRHVAAAADDATAPPPVDAAAAPFCDRTDTSLIVCFELEGSARDDSPNGLDAWATNVAFVPGRSGLAAFVAATGALDVPEHVALDPPAITIEAWIRAPWPSTGTRAGIVDNQGQYGFFLQPEGSLQCLGLTLRAAVPADTWTHVACTYDGTIRLYVNGGKLGESGGGGGPLGSGGFTGISIGADNPPGAGSPLRGDIDQVRIFARARSTDEVCRAALRTDCAPL